MDSLSTAKRDAVARLCPAQAAGLLSVEAFDQRYALIREAGSPPMVEAIVADLAEMSSLPGEVTSPLPLPRTPLPVEAAPSIRIPAILGSATRSGTWTVPEAIELLVILGELVLDFRDAASQARPPGPGTQRAAGDRAGPAVHGRAGGEGTSDPALTLL